MVRWGTGNPNLAKNGMARKPGWGTYMWVPHLRCPVCTRLFLSHSCLQPVCYRAKPHDERQSAGPDITRAFQPCRSESQARHYKLKLGCNTRDFPIPSQKLVVITDAPLGSNIPTLWQT